MILRKINPNMDEADYIENIFVMNQVFLNDLNENNGILPLETPVEIHPYLNEFELQNYDKYIIGTFPPISYCYGLLNLLNLRQPFRPNRLIPKPKIPFYHGNRASMWDALIPEDLLNMIFLPNNLNAIQNLINFLNENLINYGDVIQKAKRKLENNIKYSAKDENLFNIIVNKKLITHIILNKKLSRLLFNTSNTFGKNGIKITNGIISIEQNLKSFDLFFRACQDLGFKVEFKIDDFAGNIILDWTEVNIQNTNTLNHHLKTKIIFKAKITVPINNELLQNGNEIIKEFIIVTPFSPAAQGSVNGNPIVNNWRVANNMQNRKVFLRLIYSAFVNFNEENKQFLYSLNHQHN